MRVRTRGAVAAVASTLALTACGAAPGGAADGPVVVEYWAWNQGVQQQVDLFNATHDDVRLRFVQYPGNSDVLTALNNAQQAGQDVPCLVQSPDNAVRAGLDGLAAPIGEHLAPYRDRYDPAALDAVGLAGETFGVPFAANPSFLMYNRAVYEANGLTVPTTWQELIDQGRALKPAGIDVFNLAGEDPTTLLNFVQQAGATWFSVEGDSWRVTIDTPESRRATAVVQQLVDEDLVSNQTFTDLPAMVQHYDQGKMINIQLSTWQLTAWQNRLSTSIGDWAVASLPSLGGSTTTPGVYNALIVPEGCTEPQAATEVAVALTTDPDQIAISSSPTEGSGSFPAVLEAAPFVPAMVPTELLGENAGAAPAVIEQAAATTVRIGLEPPSRAINDRLAEVWAQATAGRITFDELLTVMQADATQILRDQGISVL